ncbi:MAG: 1-acyl-sn-glycerol-3-phosphate acyltransferase [Paramuribaculum sp.]|nr:1-acyl-sn-glycerol-3-phosphate acyltransferase [Paramuribaculum sp.]
MSENIDFSDIAPFDDAQFGEKMSQLVKEPGFEHAVKYVMPDVNYAEFISKLQQIQDKETLQKQIMWPFLEMLAQKTTAGISVDGLDNISPKVAYTFITNHRDIVLDASFLNLCFLRTQRPTSQVAIGDNLLIYEWITDLVKLNKSFVVKRNLRLTKALEAAKELSAYIHFAVNKQKESVWIAQREGRAKDSNDLTQESLVKMLALNGNGNVAANIEEINLVPVSISYEYDPNDYLKAREFLLKRIDPQFKKSQHDDLLSMETGLLQFKGHIHFQVGECINSKIKPLLNDDDRTEVVKRICSIIDCSIHSGYKIYPINYIAYDLLRNRKEYANEYTESQVKGFNDYLNGQLDKVNLDDMSSLDRKFMREMMLKMYANPLKNKLNAKGLCN